MRFEAQLFKPTGGEPPEMAGFFRHYALVCKYLTDRNSTPFKLGADVSLEQVTVSLVHNQKNTIRHNQGNATNILFLGRVELFNISSAQTGKIVVTPKLLTTSLVTVGTGRLVRTLAVKDPTLFQVGDKILVGSAYRTIVNIVGNEFTLDENVICDKVYVVSLATETVTALIF